MKKRIVVSFVLGILNAERTLNECLESIVSQDFPQENYEIIIIDGGSKDKTLEIVSRFMKKYSFIRLLHNPLKLSEGKGMSKDQGIRAAEGSFVVLLDHDNIILQKKWLKSMLEPFNKDSSIVASQSLLKSKKGDSPFLHYVNAIGVEDPFAIPHSLVSQVIINPSNFKEIEGKYYVHELNPTNVLFGGANGCIFKKEVFERIGGYTRDVDVFARMAKHKMKVAIPLEVYIYHKTSSNFENHLRKKALYFYRFITKDTGSKEYSWTGNTLHQKIAFFLRVAYNLSLVGPLFLAIKMYSRDKKLFWFLHPLYLFFMTLEYGLITLLFFRNFVSLLKKSK